MNWYYVEAGQQAGPVDDAGLYNLYTSGRITADSLVWNETMADWQPYNDIRTQLSPPITSTTTAIADAPPVVASSEAVCVECGRIFPVADTISYGNARVCAGCKPIFVQKLSEGIVPNVSYAPGTLNYAGFWIRFGAKLIDNIVLMAFLIIPFIILGVMSARSGKSSDISPIFTLFQVLLQLGFIFLNILYTTFFLGKYGATLGKMACSLRVVDAQGRKLTYGRALGRGAAEVLSGIVCNIGYIIAAFDDEKRALHDHIASTRVVHK